MKEISGHAESAVAADAATIGYQTGVADAAERQVADVNQVRW